MTFEGFLQLGDINCSQTMDDFVEDDQAVICHALYEAVPRLVAYHGCVPHVCTIPDLPWLSLCLDSILLRHTQAAVT